MALTNCFNMSLPFGEVLCRGAVTTDVLDDSQVEVAEYIGKCAMRMNAIDESAINEKSSIALTHLSFRDIVDK